VKKYVLYPEEGDVEVLGGVSPGEVSADVHVVVLDDARDNVRGGDTLSALGADEHAALLEVRVHVYAGARRVRLLVVRHEVDFVLLEEGVVQLPRRVLDHLVHVATVPHRLVPLTVRHHSLALAPVRQLIAAHYATTFITISSQIQRVQQPHSNFDLRVHALKLLIDSHKIKKFL
jgi:hypothetical protein